MAGPKRREHMARVASLLREWASLRGLDTLDVDRWTSLGYLHDALRGEHPDVLRPQVDARFRSLDGKILHGPAAAARLAEAGVDDEEVLTAVAFHTLGHPELSTMGRALYAADFLEPGRSFRARWRRRLRDRMPQDLDGVVRDVLAARIGRLVDRQSPMRPETLAFWNSLVGEEEWAGASAR